MVQYQLYLKINREQTDLRTYADGIRRAVLKIAPDIKVTIHREFYELNRALTRSEAIRIGRRISYTVPGLRSMIREYCSLSVKGKKSRKLFQKRKTVIVWH